MLPKRVFGHRFVRNLYLILQQLSKKMSHNGAVLLWHMLAAFNKFVSLSFVQRQVIRLLYICIVKEGQEYVDKSQI